MTQHYRVEERDGGYEPQMLYTAGRVDGEFWYPLTANGYWAEPDAFSDGNITKRSILPTREEADRALNRAMAINGEHLAAVNCSPDRPQKR